MVYVKSCHTDEKTHFKDFRRLPTTFELGFMIFVTCKTTFIWKRHINVVATKQHFMNVLGIKKSVQLSILYITEHVFTS